MELAAAGEDMKKLREIARVHIARCEAGDMQAMKELATTIHLNLAVPPALTNAARTKPKNGIGAKFQKKSHVVGRTSRCELCVPDLSRWHPLPSAR